MSRSAGMHECHLSDNYLQKAIKELNEDPETRHIEIQTLRERLHKVPGFQGRTDDAFLLQFLRCMKFDQERAFTRVINYYTMRREMPDLFDNLTPSRVRHVLEAGVTSVLKDRAPDGSRIIVFRPGKWDPDVGALSDVMGCSFLTYSKLIEEKETQVNGFTMLVDAKDFGMSRARHVTPEYFRRRAHIVQEAFPARFKRFHYLHEPAFFDVFFTIAKQFLKQKTVDRILLHGHKVDRLLDHFPAEILPEEYGGKLPPIGNMDWAEKLLACEAQFVAENKFGLLDMTIPHKTSQKADATEAMAGSFRKINID